MGLEQIVGGSIALGFGGLFFVLGLDWIWSAREWCRDREDWFLSGMLWFFGLFFIVPGIVILLS